MLLISLIAGAVLLGLWFLKRSRAQAPHLQDPALGNIDALDKIENLSQKREKKVFFEEKVEEPIVFDDVLFQETVETQAFEPEKPFQDFCVIYLMASPEAPYTGFELLQAILGADLRFGEMEIFHRYADVDTQSDVLFSVASATEPGTFDINHIARYTCQGLCFFTKLSQTEDNFYTVNVMFQTAKRIQLELGGELMDKNKDPLDEKALFESLDEECVF